MKTLPATRIDAYQMVWGTGFIQESKCQLQRHEEGAVVAGEQTCWEVSVSGCSAFAGISCRCWAFSSMPAFLPG